MFAARKCACARQRSSGQHLQAADALLVMETCGVQGASEATGAFDGLSLATFANLGAAAQQALAVRAAGVPTQMLWTVGELVEPLADRTQVSRLVGPTSVLGISAP